ncbi:type II toxin-antitoxin system PemK/MazF family toxin [Campylobacter showae]|uniref:Toxin-antitoxin protein, putative n=1 Tax=Campylobacter showae CSUNSWCD TaxID=1244083 RepID=M5INL8_9BACT|nr:type II toxin-antitoxin system PemK/MazF family toxin [Campylobacter showae]EKU10086.1 toxin-antitoxin protein, putative [Campylobacter showae CSUNSWCD]
MSESKFDEWNEVKKTTNSQSPKKIKIKVGSIYWVRVGQNVGSETYGKGDEFIRPVLVVNKIYISEFINAFIGIPLSSKTKDKSGYLYHKFTTTKGKANVALLAQIRIFDARRVSDYYKGKILNADFEAIKEKLKSNIIG